MVNNELKILLIEDNPADYAFIEEMLNDAVEYSYTISWAETLAEGMNELKKSIFDVIITDISLPDNDGLENIDKLKTVTSSIPIILLTGLNSNDIGINAVEKGAQDYLVKGNINTDLLVRSINYAVKRKAIEQQLSNANKKLNDMVLYDSLTGTINRKPFVDLFEANIERAKRENKKLGLLFLDLEKFKQINDEYGHEIGDKILIQVPKIIKNIIRDSDFIGRIGGDEFVVCLNNIDSLTSAIRVVQKINKAFSENIKVENLTLSLGVSIGVAIYPNNGESATELLKSSDWAMYKAKKQRRNSYYVFNEKLRDELALNLALEHALEKNEFKLNYQTIVDKKLNTYYAEAFLRWHSPKFGEVMPMEFIPILEKNRSIIEVGEWVFREVCNKLKMINLNSVNKQYIPVAVNISPYQLEDEFFVNKIDAIIKKTKVDPNDILMEITEKVEIKNPEKIGNVIEKLKKIGIGVMALDNFGSGYSSFSNLINFPVDIVKIDNSLIEKINVKKYRKIINALITLAKNSGLQVIATGIETEEQFDCLVKMGCDYFQGYFISKPAEDIFSVLNIRRMQA